MNKTPCLRDTKDYQRGRKIERILTKLKNKI